MDAEQAEALFALNSHGILATLLLVPVSAACALYRLALDQSVGVGFCLSPHVKLYICFPLAVTF